MLSAKLYPFFRAKSSVHFIFGISTNYGVKILKNSVLLTFP